MRAAPSRTDIVDAPTAGRAARGVLLVCDCPSLALGLRSVISASRCRLTGSVRRLGDVVPPVGVVGTDVLLVALVGGVGRHAEELLRGPLRGLHRVLLLPRQGVIIHSNGLGMSSTGSIVLPLTAAPRRISQALIATEDRAMERVSVRPQVVGPQGELSTREQEVLRRLAGGATNREIANWLVVSENTVKSHLTRIYRKLGVRSRTEAIAAYLEVV
jgi:DNA-binding CsgD family transcriptional regulator